MTPQDEDAVRRLLADARHSAPIPDDVAARLDRALAGLSTEPVTDTRATATVTPLAQRRRNATRMLVAAAAVVAVGVGVGQVLDGTSGGSADSESATAGDARTYDEDEAAGGDSAAQQPAEAAGVPESKRDNLRRQGIAQLRSQSFTDDVTELNDQFLAYAATSGDNETDGQNLPLPEALNAPLLDGAGAAAVTCQADSWGRGRFVAVRYDRLPAVLVFRRASGDTQVADLFLCGSTTPERSVTLPAP